MLAGLAKYRLTLGQARQDDLLGLIKDEPEITPLNLRPLGHVRAGVSAVFPSPEMFLT